MNNLKISKTYGLKIFTPNNVVLGNFGPTNNKSNISTTSEDIVYTNNFIGNYKMINFSTNNSNKLKISSAMFDIATRGTNLVRSAIFSDLNGSPSVAVSISDPIFLQSGIFSYKFNFKDYLLAPNTNYWIGLIDACKWYFKTSPNNIIEENNSGYSVGLIKNTTSLDGSWTIFEPQDLKQRTSLSIEATNGPEESLVFGNLINNPIIETTGNTILQPNMLMVGFNTGNASKLNLSSIECIISQFTSRNIARFILMSDNNGSPNQISATSRSTIFYSSPYLKYRFLFDNISLSPNTTYWIGPSPDTSISWNILTTENNSYPLQEYNNSGYTFVTSKISNNGLSGPWTNYEQLFLKDKIALNLSSY